MDFLIVAAIISTILFGGLFFYLYTHLRNRSIDIKATLIDLGATKISSSASFYGYASKRISIKGNGILALTKQGVYFEMLFPDNHFIIPFSEIEMADTTRIHRGRSQGFALLRITFKTPHGQDTAAWYVNHLEEWVKEITAKITC